jgi:hypothetical protein
MHDAVLEMPKELCVDSEVGTLGAFFEASVDPAPEPPLSETNSAVINALVTLLDQQLLLVLDASSVETFKERRRAIWPIYIRALRALVESAKVIFKQAEIEAMASVVYARLTTRLEEQREVLFGDKLIDQSLFTLWTIERFPSLLSKLSDAPLPKNGAKDRELGIDSFTHTLWAQFHMDAVLAAIKYGKSLSAEIQDELCEGLRAIVNAYVKMKEAIRLRRPRVAQDVVPDLPWDEEDDRLLASSMRDLNACIADDDC